MNHNVPSPCIKVCKLSYKNLLCTGCGRTKEEVTNWMFYTQEEAEKVIQECYKRLWEN
jgi:predicted Fe-S protein YdhL (DUF1289 family)